MVFAIGSDNALYVNHLTGAGYVALGGYVKVISATTHNTVFAIGSNDSGYVALGGYAQQISAGLDAAGHTEVSTIGSDNALYINHLTGAGWASLDGYVREAGATAFDIGLSGDVAYRAFNNGGASKRARPRPPGCGQRHVVGAAPGGLGRRL
jgi:hypothetical protein